VSDQRPNIESRIDRIEVTLSHAVEAIEKLASVVNTPQETKWGPILTALALLFAAAGAYTTLITLPIEREAEQLREQIQRVEERELTRERDLGRIEGKLGIAIDE
jgi:hypothetical protein